MLSDIKLVSLHKNLLPLDQFLFMDTLWLYSTLFTKQPPNWQGFMSQVVDGHFECTAVVFNLMVPLNSETNESMYSTVLFVKEQARSAGKCCATLIFDQPLYLKSNKIKYDSGDEFKSIYLRLNGFHLLSSFLGPGCKLFEGAGIDEIWCTVYAKKSIPKMIEGKVYSKCLRACLLTDAALHLTLLHTDIERKSKKEDEEQISDNDCYKEMDVDNNIFSTIAQWSTNPAETDNDVSDSINYVEETESTTEEVNQIISFSKSGPLSERVNVMAEVSKKVLSKKD